MLTLTDGMLLYHGSFTQVPQIDLHKCRQGKDFGRGFYVTSLLPNRLENQFCFCNEKAIQTLEFVRSEQYDFKRI